MAQLHDGPFQVTEVHMTQELTVGGTDLSIVFPTLQRRLRSIEAGQLARHGRSDRPLQRCYDWREGQARRRIHLRQHDGIVRWVA
eukprot:gene7233-biopygen4714